MRLLPTTGRTMLEEHFGDLADVSGIRSPLVWEITRLCLAPGAEPGVMAALVLAVDEVMRRFDLTHMLAVFEASRLRVFRRLGTAPEVLGQSGEGRGMIAVGLWERDTYGEEARIRVAGRASLATPVSDGWREAPNVAAFPASPETKLALAV